MSERERRRERQSERQRDREIKFRRNRWGKIGYIGDKALSIKFGTN